MKKVNFLDLNVKPFIPKDNKYSHELFTDKFSRALSKILQIKGIHWNVKSTESRIIRGNTLTKIPDSWHILTFSYGEQKDKAIGHIFFSTSACSEILHKLLGGSDKTPISESITSLSQVDKKVLENINGPLELCLREGLTPLLLLKDAHIIKTENVFEFKLSDSESYFYEEFFTNGLIAGEIHVVLKVSSFNKN
jgi:hypothetical protein